MKALYYRLVRWLLNRDRATRDIATMWADLLEKRSSRDTFETRFFSIYDLLLAADHGIDPYISEDYAAEMALVVAQRCRAGKCSIMALSTKGREVYYDWRNHSGNLHQMPTAFDIHEMIAEADECGYYGSVR